MHAARKTIALAVAVIFATASPAAAQTIVVTPGTTRPGQRIHISVPGCSVGPTAHVAMSAAFTTSVTLYGKAENGDADPTIRQEARPGTYPITASCAGGLVKGQVTVEDQNGGTPGVQTDNTNTWLIILAVLVLAVVAGVFVLPRRRRGN